LFPENLKVREKKKNFEKGHSKVVDGRRSQKSESEKRMNGTTPGKPPPNANRVKLNA